MAAVSHFNRGKVCISCVKGRVDPKNQRIGQCTRCSATQRLEKCSISVSASLLIACEDKNLTLQASLPMIQSITSDSKINEDTDEDTITD